MDAKLIIGKSGQKVLICFYNQGQDDYDAQIDAGLKQFGLKNERITVIALPEHSSFLSDFG